MRSPKPRVSLLCTLISERAKVPPSSSKTNEIIEKLAENGITIYKDENEEAIKIALSKLRIQQEKMQELDANILYLKKQREVGEQLKNQSKGEDDNGR